MKSRIVCVYSLSDSVAPLVGAWIEIQLTGFVRVKDIVAPLVGAWIEIARFSAAVGCIVSLPSWERGLKYLVSIQPLTLVMSLPSWERGLKSVSKCLQRSKACRSPRGSVD